MFFSEGTRKLFLVTLIIHTDGNCPRRAWFWAPAPVPFLHLAFNIQRIKQINSNGAGSALLKAEGGVQSWPPPPLSAGRVYLIEPHAQCGRPPGPLCLLHLAF